ncbi:MAG: cytochrome c3 family protein [Pyrinomonadaceae bacterium]
MRGHWKKHHVKAALILVAFLSIAASCIQQKAEGPDLAITASEPYRPESIRVTKNKDWDKFTHRVPEHDQIECNSCHARDAAKPYKLEYAGHDSCIGCHLNEWTNVKSGICVNCHNNLTAIPATMRKFPTKFRDGFNMKFDHADHDSGQGRPPQGCASCHESAGAAKTIPAGISAHVSCYNCHTPESKIGSCNTCHTLAPYSRTRPSRAVFKAVFRHSDHTESQGTSCSECHSVRAGAPQSRQVSTPAAVQHCGRGNAVECRTCHDGGRAFGGDDFSSCARCHTGAGFNLLPGNPCG